MDGYAAIEVNPTKDDSDPLVNGDTRGISWSGAGDLIVRTVDDRDNNTTIPSGALAANVIHPLRLSHIISTGTTATGIIVYR